jgi:hypothetical protein
LRAQGFVFWVELQDLQDLSGDQLLAAIQEMENAQGIVKVS